MSAYRARHDNRNMNKRRIKRLPLKGAVFIGLFLGLLVVPSFVGAQESFDAQAVEKAGAESAVPESSNNPGVEGGKFSFRFKLSKHYTRVVREDLRVYRDGSYRGFLYREQRAYLHEVDPSVLESRSSSSISSGENYYRGDVYVLKEMSKEARSVAKPIDRSYTTTFHVNSRGRSGFLDGTVPLRTNYPLLPDEAVSEGETWEGRGVEYLLSENGELMEAPFRCRYTYSGRIEYMGRPAVQIDASYSYYDRDPYDDSDKLKVRGKTDASILLYADAEGGYFIRERVERYLLGGSYGQRKETGFRLVWSEGFSNRHLDTMEERIAQALRGEDGGDSGGPASAGSSPGGASSNGSESGGISPKTDSGVSSDGAASSDKEGDIEVTRTDEGVVLNLPNIHFVPDKAVILPDERPRLDTLAKLLRKVPEASFLVKGHTADVGTEESQIALSKERAKTIIDEMVSRDFAPSRFMYKGMGGSEPVATNKTEAGRRKNRRVEVIVLPK